jgi:Uri superfamily endonuclease
VNTIERDDRGAYVLILTLRRGKSIEVGKLMKRHFQPGVYFYVGSARSSLRSRLGRYFSGPRTPHWHIDYLLRHGKCTAALCIFSSARDIECRIAAVLASLLESIEGFGSSDCRCRSHLFYLPDLVGSP